MVSKVSGRAIDELPPPNCLSLSTDQYPERDRIEAAARQLDKIAAVKKLIFDSAEQPGDRRQRMEQWLEALSSGYVRLSANPTSDMHFHGRLKIVQLENASIGTIGGTVQSISRTVADVAIENTNNVVLLFNHGLHVIGIEQKGRSADCAPGGAILIEQCEPSMIKVAAPDVCRLVAVQVPRGQVRRTCPQLEDRFLAPISAPSSALALMCAYVDFVLDPCAGNDAQIARIASDHVTDLVAAIVGSDGVIYGERLRGLRAGRSATIMRELDRSFMDSGFSLAVLARRLAVTPRYVQALLAEVETSFTDEVTRRRLDCARDILSSSRYLHKSIMEISQECGFSTVSHFHRVFRRRFDATPGEVRASIRR
jgi:AraC-like DNA-binding protein